MGVRQQFIVRKYDWEVIIYYTVDKEQKPEIMEHLRNMGCTGETLSSIESNLHKAAPDTGFIYSNYLDRKSVLVVHKASSIGEFFNTFEHEKNHLEMHMCEALDINPYSEKAAHLSGDLAQQILEEALCSISNL